MFLKATDDFKKRTLSALPTLLEKVAYICSLQTAAGYHHWGMERVFGDQSAQQAIKSAHLETATELVRTPIREIYSELKESMDAPINSETFKPEALILKAPVNGDGLLAAHLKLIQDSVAALAKQERSTGRVA